MTGRIAILVGAGAAATWFAAVTLNMPARESLEIGAIAGGAALAAGLSGMALLRSLRHRSVGVQVTIVALVWDEDQTEHLTRAIAFGAQVVEVRPNTPLAVAFRREVQAAARF